MALLPSEYDRLDYISSNGSQHIVTSIIPNTIGKIRLKLKYNTVVRQVPLGSWTNGGTFYPLGYVDNSKITESVIGLSYGSLTPINAQTDTVYDIINDIKFDKKSTINGQIVGSNISGSISGARAIYLFASNDADDGVYLRANIKMYNCTIWNTTGDLVYNFIPAKRKSDNKIGLYESINNTFYLNSGGNDFTYGQVLTPYSVSLATNPLDKGILSGAGSYYEEDECTISYAEGNETYRFVNWTGSATSTSNPYTFTVSGDASFTANLERYGRCILL